MTLVFQQLIEEAIRELTRRDPDYFSRIDLHTSQVAHVIDQVQGIGLFDGYSAEELAAAMDQGILLLAGSGANVSGSASSDPISHVLLRGLLDCFAAKEGHLGIRPPPQAPPSCEDILASRFRERLVEGSIRYFVKSSGRERVLLISSTGIPLGIWSLLLGDESLDAQILVVQGLHEDLVQGGISACSSVYEDARRIEVALAHAGVCEIHVLSWCNGSRLALELAARKPSIVKSIVLLSPTFHGVLQANRYPSPFEDTLAELHSLLKASPEIAGYIEELLRGQLAPFDAAKLGRHEDRARALLSLPPKEFLSDLAVPLSTLPQFVNYMEKLADDERYPVKEAIGKVACPMMMITGNYDRAINVDAARFVIDSYADDVIHAQVDGAGHYIQALQYPYFAYLLDCFIRGRTPESTARITVERLGRRSSARAA